MRAVGTQSWGRRSGLVLLLTLLTACGGVAEMIEEQAADLTTVPAGGGSSESSNDDSDDFDEGVPDAFRLASGAWENSCTVISADDVAAATGFTVVEERDQGFGCSWLIESVDPDVIGEPLIGWEPLRARDINVQLEAAQQASMDPEVIDGLGTLAFWRGSGVGPLGEVWARGEQIGFRVTNQFAGPNYTGDIRGALEAVAGLLLDSLASLDVLAASGDYAENLIPAETVNLPEGLITEDSLIEELSAVPLPDGAVVGAGGVYPDRASQDVFTDLGVGDAVRFYLEALPAAGFEITANGTVQTEEDVYEYLSQTVSFLDPNGNRGDVIIREGFFAPSQLNIQIFLP